MRSTKELRNLAVKLEALRGSNMVNARENAEAANTALLQVVMDFERRIQRMEKLFENVEVMG